MPACQPRRARGGGAALGVRNCRGDQAPDPRFWGSQSGAGGAAGKAARIHGDSKLGPGGGCRPGGPRAAVP